MIVFLSVFFLDNSSRTHTGFLRWRMTKSFSVQRQAFTSSFKSRKLEIVICLSPYLREARGLLNDVIDIAMQQALNGQLDCSKQSFTEYDTSELDHGVPWCMAYRYSTVGA